jgi:hypothetical protein
MNHFGRCYAPRQVGGCQNPSAHTKILCVEAYGGLHCESLRA